MGKDTKVQWCDHTFNCWRGCSKVSKGCSNCYADAQARRNPKVLGIWGPTGTRVVASESMWKEPLKWDREAKVDGVRRRVFCASMADVFEEWAGEVRNANGCSMYLCADCGRWLTIDKQCCGQNSHTPLTLQAIRERLFELIQSTPNLTWLLLTKRPENIGPMLWGTKNSAVINASSLPDNVWIGTSVEDQETADARIPHLLKVPAKIRFLSAEPLLGPVRLDLRGIHLVIVGGESGSNARPFNIQWCRSIIEQCKAAAVPVFVKQLGANPLFEDMTLRIKLVDPKGGDPDEWPEDLRIRESPA